jgi:PAS domain S-box-containing protein
MRQRNLSRIARFDSGDQFSRYFLAVVLLAPGVSAFVIAASRFPGRDFWTSFETWFLSGTLTSLALAPFILLVRKRKRNEDQFRSLADAAPVMLWMSDADAHCTFFNKSWLEFTGLSAKEQLELDWVAGIHPEDRERCVNQYLSAVRSRENFSMEYRLLRHDGVYRWLLHTGVPRYDADATFLGYIGNRADFSDRRESEDRLRQLNARLLNAQEIERWRIGHELQEDLAQVLCALSIDLERFSRDYRRNGDMAAHFDELQRRLRSVCTEVVRLSTQLRPAVVEGLALPAALRNLCCQATNGQRTVLFNQNEDLVPLPEDISLPLYRIAQESLQNALTHSGATCIRIELNTSATTVRLSVRDNGCGFVVATNAKPGLGLSEMSERMRSSGGIFSITSNPGEGTAVIAQLPLRRAMKAG